MTGCELTGDALARVRASLEQAVADADGRPLAVRLRLTGATALHGKLLARHDSFQAEVRAVALDLAVDAVWIEKIVTATRPVRDLVALSLRQDAVGSLIRSLDDLATDADMHATLQSELEDLWAKLPRELDPDEPGRRTRRDPQSRHPDRRGQGHRPVPTARPGVRPMRLLRLGLDRFGHFTDGALELGDAADFHLVCGNNEAGKTTTLRALSDLFFGIETRSPYNFKHDYADMRLAAEIEAADGRRLAFQRRKGRQNTLLDADGGTSLPEAALAAFLGPIDRDFFEGMFGLDHNRLRRGGEDILAARGDVGQSLFGAGAGVLGLSQVLADLDAEANALFTGRRVASKPFYQALDRHGDARKRLREAAVSGDDWRQTKAEADAVERRIRENRERLNHLESARAKAERIRRTLPMVRQIAELDQSLAGLADAVALAEDASDRRLTAMRRRDEALRDSERCTVVVQGLEAELAGLTVPVAILERGADIEALHEQRGAVRDQRSDLPKRDSELRQLREQALDLLRRLGSDLPIERAVEAIPPRSILADVRALITEQGKLRARADAAAEQLARCRTEAGKLELQLEAIGTPADSAVLHAAVAEAKARGTVEQSLSEGQTRLRTLKERIAAQVAGLPLWHGTLDELIQAKVPDESTVTRFEGEFAELNARIEPGSRKGRRIPRPAQSA